MARAQVEGVKATQIGTARIEAANLALRIGLSPKCDREYSLFSGLARVRVEPVKVVLQIWS